MSAAIPAEMKWIRSSPWRKFAVCIIVAMFCGWLTGASPAEMLMMYMLLRMQVDAAA